MRAGRIGDRARNPRDRHACSACAHDVVGPAVAGSPDVIINDRAALRVGDPGVHSRCCDANTWKALGHAPTVIFNNRFVHRLDDETEHCGGIGRLIEGSDDVIIGSRGG